MRRPWLRDAIRRWRLHRPGAQGRGAGGRLRARGADRDRQAGARGLCGFRHRCRAAAAAGRDGVAAKPGGICGRGRQSPAGSTVRGRRPRRTRAAQTPRFSRAPRRRAPSTRRRRRRTCRRKSRQRRRSDPSGSVAKKRRRLGCRQFECAEVKLLGGVGLRWQLDQRERGVGELPPDRQIFRRDGEPAVPEHVPSGLGDAPGSLPCDLVDHRPAPFGRGVPQKIRQDPPARSGGSPVRTV